MAIVENVASPLVPMLRGVHLFGFDAAPCSQRVSFALAEKGLSRGRSVDWQSQKPADQAPEGSYVFRQVWLIRQQHLSPEYAAIQPNMVLPALGKKLHVSIRYVSFHWGLGRLGRVGAARKKPSGSSKARTHPKNS